MAYSNPSDRCESTGSLDAMIQEYADIVRALKALRAGKPENHWKHTLEYSLCEGMLGNWFTGCIRCESCGEWGLEMQDDGEAWLCRTCSGIASKSEKTGALIVKIG